MIMFIVTLPAIGHGSLVPLIHAASSYNLLFPLRSPGHSRAHAGPLTFNIPVRPATFFLLQCLYTLVYLKEHYISAHRLSNRFRLVTEQQWYT